MRKVLIIVYDFPPSNTVTSLRFRNLIKHMSKYGWQPYVLTRKVWPDEYRYDVELLNTLPKNLKIVRIRSFDLMKLLNKLRRFAIFFQYERPWSYSIPKSILLSICDLVISKPFLWLSFFLIRFVYVFPPDSNICWIPFIYHRAQKIILREKIDLLITHGAPGSYSTHLAGYCIKRKFTLPWVVSYEDEWSQHPWREPVFKWQRRLERRLERKVLLAANRVIAVTPSYRTLFSQLVPQELAKHFETITCSYDEDDFKYEQRIHSKKFIRFAYIGSLYQDQTPLFFLKALKQLIENKLMPLEKVRLTFAGMVEHKLQLLFQDTTLEPIITYHGICSHKDGIKYTQDADVLVLIIASTRGEGNIPAKLFEYVGSGKPILALVPENGDAAEIIRRAGTGIIVPPEDIGAVANAIYNLFKRWERSELKIFPNWDEIKIYETKCVTKKFSEVLDSTLAENADVV